MDARPTRIPAVATPPSVTPPLLARYAESELPTRWGRLRVVVYRETPAPIPSNDSSAVAFAASTAIEHMAIIADRLPADDALCRIHSECWTGETLSSLKCDCREQLEVALETIVEAGGGVVVYLRQEGRGIGLGNKIRAYALQNEGADTVEANTRLGFPADARDYALAAAILADLGVRSVALMTNNPDKVAGLERSGVRVVRRIPHWVVQHEHNREYLRTKRSKLGHRE